MLAEVEDPEPAKQELIDLFKQLGPMDQAEVLRFTRASVEARMLYMRPPNAYTWSHLTKWQRKTFYCLVLFHATKARATKYLRSMLSW